MGNWISTVFAAGAKRLVNLEKMMVAIKVEPANGIDEEQNTENASGGVTPLPLHSPHSTNEENEEDEENALRNNVHSSNLPSHAFAVNAAAAAAAAAKSMMLKWPKLLRVPETEEERDTQLKSAFSFTCFAYFDAFAFSMHAKYMDKPLRTSAWAILVLVVFFSVAIGIVSYDRPASKERAMVAKILVMLLVLLTVAFNIAMLV